MKGIILVGGYGSRLYPLTMATNKHLLAVYDKPLVYYPLATLMLAGLRDILLITNPNELTAFQTLLADGKQWGINLSYLAQDPDEGLAESINHARGFLGQSALLLALGDNVLYGPQMHHYLQTIRQIKDSACLTCYEVSDPSAFGVIDHDGSRIMGILEKPSQWPSKWAITGLYAYPSDVTQLAASLEPARRKALELPDLNRAYLGQNRLSAQFLDSSFSWFDAGTHHSLYGANELVKSYEQAQGQKICCPEEIAWRLGYINDAELARLGYAQLSSAYGQYLLGLFDS